MNIKFLCNAGLWIEHNEKVLLVDLPNGEIEPFYTLPDEMWHAVCEHQAACGNVAGFFFTHDHPDHLCKTRLSRYLASFRNADIFIPSSDAERGIIDYEGFRVEYQRFEHAPIPNAPPHVVAKISAGDKLLYVSGDAALDCNQHMCFLEDKKVDAAVWTPMYLSRPETRKLMSQVSERNFIYHMPLRSCSAEIWKKADKNLQRYGSELRNVTIVDRYPYAVEI